MFLPFYRASIGFQGTVPGRALSETHKIHKLSNIHKIDKPKGFFYTAGSPPPPPFLYL